MFPLYLLTQNFIIISMIIIVQVTLHKVDVYIENWSPELD